MPLNHVQILACLRLYRDLQEAQGIGRDEDAVEMTSDFGAMDGAAGRRRSEDSEGGESDMAAVRASAVMGNHALVKMNHFLLFATASYGWEYVGVYRQKLGVEGLLLDNKITSNLAAISAHTRVPKEDVLFHKFESELFKPAHFFCVDHRTLSVVLAIRGSFGVSDALTDIVATAAPIESDGVEGHAHSGMLKAARWITADLQGAFELALKRYEGYTPVIVGHSLGAGVATLAGLLMKDSLPDLKVYAFAAPATLTQPLADSAWCRESVVSVVNGNDIVPRLSLRSLDDVSAILIRLNNHHHTLPLLSPWYTHKADARMDDISLPEHAAREGQQEEPRLLIAGSVLHIVRLPDEKVPWTSFMSPFRTVEPNFRLVKRSPKFFDRILLWGTPMSDHLPDKYEEALQRIIAQARHK